MKQFRFSQFNSVEGTASPRSGQGVGLVRLGLSSRAQCVCACALRICVDFPVVRRQRTARGARKFGREGDMGDMDSIPPSWGDMAGMDDMGDMRTLPRD